MVICSLLFALHGCRVFPCDRTGELFEPEGLFVLAWDAGDSFEFRVRHTHGERSSIRDKRRLVTSGLCRHLKYCIDGRAQEAMLQ